MKTLRFIGPVAAITLLVAGIALAQQPVNDGRALDANNRVGSGGYNDGRQMAPGVTGNRVVTGNVTGGIEFRGPVPYRDPAEFTGPLGGVTREDYFTNTGVNSTESFIRRSSGPGAAYQSPQNPYQPRTFYYSRSLAGPAPAGYTQAGDSGAYVATPVQPGIGQAPGDTRLSLRLEPISSATDGSALGGGTVSPADRATYLVGSPLYGLRAWRDETLVPPQPFGAQPATRPAGQLAPTMLAPGELAPRRLDDQLQPEPMGAVMRSDQSLQTRYLSTPSEQSSQYAELRKKLEDYYTERLGQDQSKYQDLLNMLERRYGPPEKDPSRRPKPATRPAWMEKYGPSDLSRISRELAVRRAIDESAPPATRPSPVKVESLATGVKTGPLAERLQRAEKLMQGGLYASAVEQYEAAEQMAPNNPLIWLGRAHAALGAGYYALAEAQLRRSLSADPTLLMGQYDLKRMVGADRLAYLVSDLKTIASRDQRNHVPMVLLAYIAYNLGRESEASDWLQTAHTRSGGDDLLVRILREHWHGAAPAQRKTPRPE